MKKHANDPYFAPIVTGTGFQHIGNSTLINFNSNSTAEPLTIEQTFEEYTHQPKHAPVVTAKKNKTPKPSVDENG